MKRPRPIERLTSWVNEPSESDRAAGLELAVASRRFSRRTKAVVDDKLSFSAALMRAGEVDAANRMLAEVQQEVLTEEVALLERVNEVKVAQSMEPRPTTRARLARTLAVAMIGSSVLAFSAAGAMVAGFFSSEDQAIHGPDPEAAGDSSAQRSDEVLGLRHVKIANVPFTLTSDQFRRYTKLTTGQINEDGLQLFLLQLLPPGLAQKVHFALIEGIETLPEPVQENLVALAERLDDRQRQAVDGNHGSDEPTNEPSGPEPSPQPSDSPSPGGDPTPNPTEEPEDEGDPEIPIVGDDEGEG